MPVIKKHKICFIGPNYYKYAIGGSEVQMYLLAKEFLKKAWEVHYVTSGVSQKTIDEGIVLQPYSAIGAFRNNYKKLKTILSKIDADVYYQMGRTLFSAFAGKFAQETGKLFIFATSMDIDCRRYKAIPRIWEREDRNLLRNLLSVPRAFWIDRRSLHGMQNASLILSQSAQQREMLKKNLQMENITINSMHYVPNLEDIEKLAPPIALWLATVKRWKQPELFIKLADKLQHLDCRFILAGKMGDSYYRDIIQDALARMNNLKYIEKVSLEECNALIAKASVFVNTSLPNEGFPNTFIQSWLRMVPTVSLHFDPDHVIEKHNLGYHSKTFEQLVTDVSNLVVEKHERESIGKTAREYAKKEFGAGENFDKLYTMIEHIVVK